jgi:hypothetical protein
VDRQCTLPDVEQAVRAAWGVDVCEDPADVPRWSPANPSSGQCGPTALVVNDLLGGDLVVAGVHLPDGSARGYHWWNRLPDGAEVDLTREQFTDGEILVRRRVLARPPGRMKRGEPQYLLLRGRVLHALEQAPSALEHQGAHLEQPAPEHGRAS